MIEPLNVQSSQGNCFKVLPKRVLYYQSISFGGVVSFYSGVLYKGYWESPKTERVFSLTEKWLWKFSPHEKWPFKLLNKLDTNIT